MSELTVAENVALPLILLNVAAADIKRRVTDILVDLNLLKFSRSFPQSLSGGEKQRVAVARAVIHRPKLLLADEPTASLDSQAADLVLDTISKLAAAYSLTVIMATHDPRVHKRFPQKLELFDGKFLRR
jgi:putative ABC transport system ATP-binding protein